MTIQEKIERPLRVDGLVLGDDNVFDSIDGDRGKKLARIFGYVASRFVLRISIEEIGEARMRVTMEYEVCGYRRYQVSFAGRLGKSHKMSAQFERVSIHLDHERKDPLLTYYALLIG